MATTNKTSTKITAFMTGIVLCGFAIILAMNIASMFGVVPSTFISPNDVRGVAVEHDGKLYTLNFAQQNTLVDIFNRSKPITKQAFEKQKIDKPLPKISKIVIYRFNAEDLEATPVGYISKVNALKTPQKKAAQDKNNTQGETDGHFVYSLPEWNKDGYLEEQTAGELSGLLQSTYDH